MEEKGKQSFTILVIDDDDRIRTLIRDILLYGGHRVVEASDGISGMNRLQEGGFDMVFTDLVMPVMNGWEVAKWIKSKNPNMPVALITGWGTDLDKKKIEESGVNVILTKPFQVDEVLAAVDRLMLPP